MLAAQNAAPGNQKLFAMLRLPEVCPSLEQRSILTTASKAEPHKDCKTGPETHPVTKTHPPLVSI